MYAPSFGEVFSPRLLTVRIQLVYTPSKSLRLCNSKSSGPGRPDAALGSVLTVTDPQGS